MTNLVSSRLVSSRLVSSRLVSSRLVSSRLVSSRLVSSRLVSSRLVSSRLVSSRLVSSRLVSSRLVSSRLVSSRLVSSRLVSSRLVSSRLVSSRLVSSRLVSSRLVSSRLVSSRLVSSRLVSSRLVSSRLVSSRLVSSRLVSSRLVSSRLVSSRLVSSRLVSSRLVLASLLVLTSFGQAEANFVTYTETVTGSGTLGALSFSNALVTITGTGDTNNVMASNPPLNLLMSTTVSVSGIGMATFTSSFTAKDIQGVGQFQFYANTNSIVLAFNNASLDNYDLTTSIGPLSGSSVANYGGNYGTTSGNFILNSSSNGSFSAVVASSSVPEPASLGMMGFGVAVAAIWARAKARREIDQQIPV